MNEYRVMFEIGGCYFFRDFRGYEGMESFVEALGPGNYWYEVRTKDANGLWMLSFRYDDPENRKAAYEFNLRARIEGVEEVEA